MFEFLKLLILTCIPTKRSQKNLSIEVLVNWYNTEHLHSGIKFVTPDDRHFGKSEQILNQRRTVYEKAKRKNPQRWSRETRDWNPVENVVLNPSRRSEKDAA
jgi:hypothetical protein